MQQLQRAIALIYPDQCVLCDTRIARSGALCPSCWGQIGFITGLTCGRCGLPLPGDATGEFIECDECLSMPRPWQEGRAAIRYEGKGRDFVLALKHGDRPDLSHPASEWLWRAGRAMLDNQTVLVPVPVHWTRLLRRRYNQSAELTRALAHRSGLAHVPDLLLRTRRTPTQDGRNVAGRIENLHGAIAISPKHRHKVPGRSICLIDDVMASGATLMAAADALRAAGATRISVLVLARAVKSN